MESSLLIYEPTTTFSDALHFLCQTQIQGRTSLARTPLEARQFLESGQIPDLAVYALSEFENDEKEMMAKSMAREKIHDFVILADEPKRFSAFKKASNCLAILKKPDVWPALQPLIKAKHASRVLNPGAGVEFLSVSTHLLSELDSLPVDIYRRLSETSHVRAMASTNGEPSKAMLQRLIQDKVLEVYITREDILALSEALQEQLMSPRRAVYQRIAGSIPVSYFTHRIWKDLIPKLGMSPEVENLVNLNVRFATEALTLSPSLDQILGQSLSRTYDYLSSHSVLTAEIACYLGWRLYPTQTQLQLDLATAGILHDAFVPKAELAEVRNYQDLQLRQNDFSKEEIQAYLQHPEAILRVMLQSGRGCTPDLQGMLKFHHSFPLDAGFPQLRPSDMTEPLAIFLLAHAIAHDRIMGPTSEEAANQWSIRNFVNAHPWLGSHHAFSRVLNAILPT